MLAEWFMTPHLVEWWGDPDASLADVRKAIASDSTQPFIVELDGRAVAYLQCYDPYREDGHPYRDQPPGTLGFDLSIGPDDLLGAGHGSAMLRQAVEDRFDAGMPRAIIDPDPKNLRAIRAYEKAGFDRIEQRMTIYGEVLLMKRDAPTPGHTA